MSESDIPMGYAPVGTEPFPLTPKPIVPESAFKASQDDPTRLTKAYGTVMLTQIYQMGEVEFSSVRGVITIYSTEQFMGFRVTPANSNWVAVIRGKTQYFYAFGCQIKGFLEHPVDAHKPASGVYIIP